MSGLAPRFLPPKPQPRPRFRAASVLAPMPPRLPRALLTPHPPTLAWRAPTYYTDYLIRSN